MRQQPDLNQLQQSFQVGDWLVEPDSVSIKKGTQIVKLEPRVMDLLVYMAQRPGLVLSREELEQAIWTGTVVGYDALTSAIIKIRKAMGDNSRHPWLIETISKKGYRFIAKVTPLAGDAPPLAKPIAKQSRVKQARILIILGIFIMLAAGAFGWLALRPAAPTTTPIPSIVVLPFANLSGDPKFEYFSDGITDDITTDMSKLSGLLVIAANSANIYKHQPLSIKSVANALKVRYVVEGSVRRDGKEIRINARLIDSHTGTHLWAERYDRQLKDIFAVQDNVTHNIVKALSITLTAEEKRLIAHRYTDSVEAYDLLLQGQSLYARSNKQDNARAREFYLRAIDIDPNFARAYAALALTYTEDFRFSWTKDPSISLQQAIDMAHKAVSMDDSIPQTNWVLGYVEVSNKHFAEAAKAAERAISMDHNNADAITTLAYCRVYQDRSQDAVTLMQKAKRLNPNYPSRYSSILGRAYYYLGKYDLAVKNLREAIEKNPVRAPPRLYLVLTYVAMGKIDDANWEVTQLTMNNTSVTLNNVDQVIPETNPQLKKKMVNDLRRAGLQ